MREEILQKISSALGGRKHNGTPTDLSPFRAQPLTPSDRAGDIKRFQSELERVGGRFYIAESSKAACDYILELASSVGARSALGWDDPINQEVGFVEALKKAGIEFIADTGSDGFTEKSAVAGIGISGVDYALADTGTLVVLSGPGRARSVSLLPPVHVAVVKPEQVLAELNDLFPLLKARGKLNSAIAFITGPSRTADIEMTLVVGVHGPQQLHVVMLDSQAAAR